MDETGREAAIGRIVRIKQGRDAGQYAVIVEVINERFVLVADGEKKRFDRPKKKNLIHLELQEEVGREVADSIEETGRVTNGKLRFVLQRYRDQDTPDV